jgi:hypothetical protein
MVARLGMVALEALADQAQLAVRAVQVARAVLGVQVMLVALRVIILVGLRILIIQLQILLLLQV